MSEWISVDDRLPNDTGIYWVAFEEKRHFSGNKSGVEPLYFDGYEFLRSTALVDECGKVNFESVKCLYWQPYHAPKPPEESQ